MKIMAVRVRSWTTVLLALVGVCTCAHLLAGWSTWDSPVIDSPIITAYLRLAFLAPNQFGLFVDEFFSGSVPLLGDLGKELVEDFLFLAGAIPLAIFLGRKLTAIQQQRGLLFSILVYAGISLVPDAIIEGLTWHFFGSLFLP